MRLFILFVIIASVSFGAKSQKQIKPKAAPKLVACTIENVDAIKARYDRSDDAVKAMIARGNRLREEATAWMSKTRVAIFESRKRSQKYGELVQAEMKIQRGRRPSGLLPKKVIEPLSKIKAQKERLQREINSWHETVLDLNQKVEAMTFQYNQNERLLDVSLIKHGQLEAELLAFYERCSRPKTPQTPRSGAKGKSA